MLRSRMTREKCSPFKAQTDIGEGVNASSPFSWSETMPGIKLYDHQLDALFRINNGSVLCGGVGSGKSITSIGYFYLENGGDISTLTGGNYVPMKNPKDLYIITTARKRDTHEWEKELTPFLMNVDPELNMYSNKIMIDSWNNIQKYIDVKDAFFIFDEQRIVGSGVWVKSFLKIAKKNKWILLSATPGDTYIEYAPLFIANGFYKNRSEFIREHVVYYHVAKFPKIDRYIGVGLLDYYRRQIVVEMSFDRKTVPHHIDVEVPYNVKDYKNTIRTRWNFIKEEPIQNAGELCYLLRRIINTDDSRIQAVQNISREKKRIIVFYNFDYELEILLHAQYEKGTVVAQWNGHKHEPIPDSDSWVYLVQYTAGAEGWNCIDTDTVVFFSQNYSYKIMVQSAGRIDRLNTPFKDLYYYHLKSKSGIDVAISMALKEKRTFNENLFEKGKWNS